ncbi:MAG: S46 family peptidase [Bacteroidales bacterium]
MQTRLFLCAVIIILGFAPITRADEGMWLPILINRMNYSEMQQKGLKLSADQIYSLNQACLKDAIVSLDYGSCSSEVISASGLLLTNHHCGLEVIQEHSTIDHNYITDGFWAMKQSEELPNPGKTASFLISMEDVTARVLANVTPGMAAPERQEKIDAAVKVITKEAIGDTHYEAGVESMFEGSEYYLFVYETFRDVRLVGAPPASIGDFGGDTDNWMWPRHTGDFCLLRVYSGPDGKPAEYSTDNVPLKPKYVLPISLKGIKEGDFAMIWGYPGSTDRFVTSDGIRIKLDQLNPAEVKLKRKKMEIIKAAMDADPVVKIKYTGKYDYLGNFWKKALIENKALEELKVYDDRKNDEDAFAVWVEKDEMRRKEYGQVLPDLAEVYKEKMSDSSDFSFIYVSETFAGSDILMLAANSSELSRALTSVKNREETIRNFKEEVDVFFSKYDAATDKKILSAMFELYYKDVPAAYQPDFFKLIKKKYKGNFSMYVDRLFDRSIFASRSKMDAFLAKPDPAILMKDPMVKTTYDLTIAYYFALMKQMVNQNKFNTAKRLLIEGLRQMNHDKKFYPDANSTMRVTYGSVVGYVPRDAVECLYRTTLKGVMEKEDPNNEEFRVPEKLKTLYANKDYGKYAENGIMPLCFLTDNDITGGNSGSPVLNGKGQLIGAAFDGNSESMSSDIKFDSSIQRTIVCDIRYILFVIDKYAGAGYLINEMNVVSD